MSALRADGSEFPVEMILWRTAVGTETFYTVSLFDLSERQAAQTEIERQREALRQSEKLTAMGSLLAGVAHELNNPLSIVMGPRPAGREALGQALAADAQRINEASERCGRIVRTFLNMARSRPANRSEVSLNDLATAAIDMLGYALRSHGIDIEPRPAAGPAERERRCRPDRPDRAEPARQCPAGTDGRDGARRITVSTGLTPTSEHGPPPLARVWLHVRDNGPGIRRWDRIFEPFTTKRARAWARASASRCRRPSPASMAAS